MRRAIFFIVIWLSLILTGIFSQIRLDEKTAAPELPALPTTSFPSTTLVSSPAKEESNQDKKTYNLKVAGQSRERILAEAREQNLTVKEIEELDIIQVQATPEQVKKIAPRTEYVEEEGLVKIFTVTPNDPLYSQQTNLTTINAARSWNQTKGANGSPNIIAVLDTGVKGDHPDLEGKILSGYDYVNQQPLAANYNSDDNGHGTEVAGVIAANTDNNIGIAGINWNGQILPIKIINKQGVGTTTNVAMGIRCAADNGAKVINMSFGGSRSQVVADAIEYAWSKGLIIVAASGNDGTNELVYPAADDKVIAVGSVNNDNNWSSFSNYGSSLDIVAPGENIYTTDLDGDYSQGSGTSLSAPEVAAAIGLFLSKNSSFTPDQILSKLEETAQRVSGMDGQNFSDRYGYGLLEINGFLISADSTPLYAYHWVTAGPYSGPGSARDPISPSQTTQLFVTLLNSGSQTWSRDGVNPVHLGMSQPIDRRSPFANNSSLRMVMDESSVAPGENGTFRLNITAPYQPGEYWEHFDMVIESIKWVGGDLPWFIRVGNPLSARYVVGGQEPHTADSIIHLSPGESTTLTVRFVNTSSANWYNWGEAPIYLGTARPIDRVSSFTNNQNVRGTMIEGGIAHGETAAFIINITAPSQRGTYKEYYDLVVDRVGWIETGLYWDIVVE